MDSRKIVPCLWLDGRVEEAAAFYQSVFKHSKPGRVTRYSKQGAEVSGQPQGSLMTLELELEGFKIVLLNGGPQFKLSPAVSFYIWCESEAEIDERWAKLAEGGKALLPLDKYPFASKYGWCQDRFGVSWQLLVEKREQKICPALLFTKEQARKAEEAMKLYTSLFDGSGIESLARDDSGKVVLHARFKLAGQDFVALESPIDHDFTFSCAESFIVNCEDQNEIDRYFLALSAAPEAEICGWVCDKFGVSWQIVPWVLPDLLADPMRYERVMEAVLKMKKFDMPAMHRAAEGAE